MRIGVVCTSFHKKEIKIMLNFAKEESAIKGVELVDIQWVPGAMEVPLALDRMLNSKSYLSGAITLGIIENGETQHGLAMGQSVINSILNLQLKYNKPIGLGIIGPGVKKEHIAARLEPHARAAVNATIQMSS